MSEEQTSQKKNKTRSHRSNASESSLEDDKLVKQALSGKEEAYQQLVSKYRRSLFFHIKKMIKDQKQVEDLVQESFVKAFDNLDTYNTNYAFSTWLYRIATNHTIDYHRKKKLNTFSYDKPLNTREGEMKMQLEDQHAETDRGIIRKERQEIIRNAIQDLPDKYRRVIELRHMEEKSYQEISDQLNKPLGTVKAHIFRAREMLYKSLKAKRGRF